MTEEESVRSWEGLERLLETADPGVLVTFLDSLAPGEVVLAVSHLTVEQQLRLFDALPVDEAADVVGLLPPVSVAPCLARLTPERAAKILHELPSDVDAALLTEVGDEPAARILAAMEPAEARDVRQITEYADGQAGRLMVKEFLAYPEYRTVGEVVEDLRENADKYANYNVQYAYVTNRRARLVGVLRMRDLLLARPTRRLSEKMIRDPLTVPDTADVEALCEFFDGHAFFGVPIVDGRGRILGVVHREAVTQARAEQAESDFRKAQGIVGGEELRSMPLIVRSRRRLGWLSINVVLNVIAASIIALYRDTLAEVIALAVFLPIISDMSGCSGNQAVAVTMRELTLGLVHPTELLRVWLKEILVGLINGCALGGLLALTGWLYVGNPWFGLVVGGALALNTVVAVSVGGTVPLLLRRFGMDPALASGPILTTVTDMCGFLFALGFATLLLGRLAA